MSEQSGVPISILPAASDLTGSDVLAGVQSGGTKKFSLAALAAWVKAQTAPGDIGAVPVSRKVNGKSLAGNISLTAQDVGAAEPEDIPAAGDAVPARDGAGSPGSSGAYARADHVHPAALTLQTFHLTTGASGRVSAGISTAEAVILGAVSTGAFVRVYVNTQGAQGFEVVDLNGDLVTRTTVDIAALVYAVT